MLRGWNILILEYAIKLGNFNYTNTGGPGKINIYIMYGNRISNFIYLIFSKPCVQVSMFQDSGVYGSGSGLGYGFAGVPGKRSARAPLPSQVSTSLS